MYEGYISNIGPNVSAVLVSTTSEEELKRYELKKRDTYRDIIYKELFREGVSYTKGDYESLDPFRLKNVWHVCEHIDPAVFVREYLDDVCHKYAQEFMVLHRVSRVLRKCCQYQDLMLLSEGVNEAFSYCDPEYYGKSARPYRQPLFHYSDDVNNIIKRKFDYTLVLDADSEVPKGFVTEIMQIAAAHPERVIIQPAIERHCKPDDTVFMHLEYMKQATYTPMINAIMTYFGQSGFFGKALIQNRLYFDKVIGTKVKTIERVPIDVLSHDTFEAAILKPLYAGSVHLLEAPSYNYITWNIRERRWNKGEILLAMYFWPNAFGKLMRFLQKIIQRQKYNKTKFTPDAVVGTVRIVRSLVAIFSLNVQWIPQRAIEYEFIFSNPFVSSLKHLWGYSLFALIASVAVCLNLKAAFINLFMCMSLFLLPVYNGFTSLSPNFKISFKQRDRSFTV
ncbi:hypothetical protein CHS0354_003875 [Potamilus streckersoni]|uniref:Uncharacterized protein n=1 Tax=Potamilus streckersoni TaxID=2493646 RepID=A0AAE0TJ13_9BIVA|nr:hypothetical protein CHS0354_003875 [Potamilus streckersoni]